MESQHCWVVEKIYWDEDVDGLGLYWEQRAIVKAFMTYEDAKRFVEKDAFGKPYDFKWKGTANLVYSGSVKDDHMMEGVTYELHRVDLF